MKEKIVLIGGGGHAKVVVDAILLDNKYEVEGIIDLSLEKGTKVSECIVLGDDSELEGIFKSGIKKAFIGIGSIGDCSVRKRIYLHVKKIGFELPVIIHPKAVIAGDVVMKEGTFVAASANINTGSKLGCNVIVNTAASIDHDCIVEDFVHISPKAVLCGGVSVGRESHIGAGACLVQNKVVGANAIVGAGCTVLKDVGGNEVFTYKQNLFDQLKDVRGKKIIIIAEAGVNHNGDCNVAKKMIDAAVDCGVDAIKFQTFKAENLVRKDAQKAEYQKDIAYLEETQQEMLRKLQLDEEAFQDLFNYCNKKKILFLSSGFDIETLEFLDKMGMAIFKIPSGEITNLPYLRKVGSFKKPIIMSTGMANLEEVRRALDVLIDVGVPKNLITILHCNTQYPTPFEDVNLSAMLKMKQDLGVDVGYSDHSLGLEVPIAVAILGASVIEKHFTLDKTMQGPDHKASLEPKELKVMTQAIRNVQLSLGDEEKKVSLSEIRNRDIVRRSIVSSKEIKKGEFLTDSNITAKRPADGISPMEWDNVIGKKAIRDFKKDELIEL